MRSKGGKKGKKGKGLKQLKKESKKSEKESKEMPNSSLLSKEEIEKKEKELEKIRKSKREKVEKKVPREISEYFDKAVNGLESGDESGLHSHALKGKKYKGTLAADVKGSGGGRGGYRIIYSIDEAGEPILEDFVTSHKYKT